MMDGRRLAIQCRQPGLRHGQAADEFHSRTEAPNQLCQADLTYLKVTDWGWCTAPGSLDNGYG
jgi:hypothetical protein